jgi:leucyl-tRNA synthetase
MYVGGIEHSTMHHLYARFVWKALYDLGHIPPQLGDEPFARLRLHGMIIKDGAKISKSRGNVIIPDAYVSEWGADVMRTYMLFMAPYEEGGDFRDAGIVGVRRFFNRLWDQITMWTAETCDEPTSDAGCDPAIDVRARRILHRTIKRATEDIESLSFNTAIAALMEGLNGLRPLPMSEEIQQEATRTLVLLLAPFAPHLAEELWELTGQPYSVHQQPWPEWEKAHITAENITLIVQVNGKVRDRLQVPADIDDQSAQEAALASDAVQQHLEGQSPRRVVVVPGKLVNVVV